eukprot:TRINITY_DN18044_c0_g1_i6.p1 TRINITY_DN18044_c0_g1~~TRINITY_DN18044_c0_g1_i6.p1  ORF type:complete len:112 (+),score=24.09 TRINITY_DN18044_c0_g1_i6:150-485(+)
MIRRPPRSTLSSSSAASDVYKRQVDDDDDVPAKINPHNNKTSTTTHTIPVSYTHLRAHETPEHLVCRLLLEKKKKKDIKKHKRTNIHKNKDKKRTQSQKYNHKIMNTYEIY